MKTREYQAASRKPMVWRLRLRFPKDVAYSSDGVNDLRVGFGSNLFPQPAHQHIHHVRLRLKVVSPNMFQNHGFGNHLPGMAHEGFEQSKLPGLEVNFPLIV